MHAADGRHARDAAARSDDYLSADLLAENLVRRADVADPFRRDRRGLQAQAGVSDGVRSLVHDTVLRRTPSSSVRS